MTPAPTTEARELVLLDSLVTSIAETRAAVAALQALEVTLLASAEVLADEQTSRLTSSSSRDRDMPRRSIAAEIATATRTSDRTVQRRMDEASALTRSFPAAVRALGAGRIDRAHLSVIFETGAVLTDAAARADFERAAVSLAQRESPGRLRPLLRTLAERLEPSSIDSRHAAANERRGVWVQDLDDGMAQLIATLPTAVAHAIRDRLTRLGHEVIDAREPSGDDRRTLDQLRADALSDLLLTAEPTAVPRSRDPIVATVQVLVPVATLTGQGSEAAELVGHGPIDRDTARCLAGAAPGWDRIFTDRATGAVIAVDRYRPSEEQRRLLRARDERCRFPGCRMPVHRCDVDHTVDAARGGATSTCNLAHLCRRHHSLKHASDWTVLQRPDGTLVWSSPTGRVHLDEPPSRVRFRMTGDPPPF